MKITNKYGLPQALVNAVQNDPYSRGDADYSVTQLLQPARIVALQRSNHEKLEEDVSDRVWSLYGQIVHQILERAACESSENELRLFAVLGGVRVSGQIDRLIAGTVQDFKFVTAYKFKDGCPEEFENQLNCYAALARLNGRKIDKLELVGLLRDWSKLEAKRDSRYPQAQVILVPVPLWPEKQALDFLTSRIVIHEQAKTSLPECTPKETWERPTVWAVMAPGRVTAVKLYNSEGEAEMRAQTKAGLYVVKREGVVTRCQFYCPVAQFCTQFSRRQK